MAVYSESLYPILSHHIFWNKKRKFQLSVDHYRHWVMFAVESGSFSYRIGECQSTARPGDLIICPSGFDFHRTVLQELSFHFIGFAWESLSAQPLIKDKEEQALCQQLADTEYRLNARLPDRLFVNLNRMKQLPGSAEEELLYWKKHILTDIWHFCLSSHTKSDAIEARQHDPLVEQAIHVLQQYGYGELSIVSLASELGISPVQLSRRFSKQTGRTPSAYLTALRLEKAKTLLTETRLPLEQIAQQCGFSNGFYLSRVFTKTLKINPSMYRRMNQV